MINPHFSAKIWQEGMTLAGGKISPKKKKVKVLVAQLCPTLCNPMNRLLCLWASPGKNTGEGCHFLLQGIFPTQGSNPGLPHCRQTLHPLSHQGIYIYRERASQVVLVVKNLPANAGDARDVSLILESGRSAEVGNGNPLQYSCPENCMDRGAWRAIVHGVAKGQTRLSN